MNKNGKRKDPPRKTITVNQCVDLVSNSRYQVISMFLFITFTFLPLRKKPRNLWSNLKVTTAKILFFVIR